jgi:acyl carrier protein
LLALEMLAAFERKYRIEIPEETLPEFTSVDKVIEVVLAQMSPATIESLVAAAAAAE